MTEVKNEEQSNNANVLLADSKNGLAPKLFELGWGWYEDWSYHLFIHFGKTQDDFKQDVKSLLVKYGQDYLASEQSWAGANGWVDFIAEKMPELGYQPIQPIRESFFGLTLLKAMKMMTRRGEKLLVRNFYKKRLLIIIRLGKKWIKCTMLISPFLFPLTGCV